MSMTERELVKQLSALKNVVPDQAWVKKNRDVLSYQIFNGSESAARTLSFFEQLSLISKRVLQPTPIAALIAIFFLVSGAFGIHAAGQTNPGSPLYIAKQISEKAQLATTFNEKERARLNIEFANKRMAEYDRLVTENEGKTEVDPRLEEVAASFKKEISSARARIDKINATKKAPVVTEKIPEVSEGVFSADSNKEDKGLDISTPATRRALEEASRLLNENDYDGAANQLDQTPAPVVPDPLN